MIASRRRPGAAVGAEEVRDRAAGMGVDRLGGGRRRHREQPLVEDACPDDREEHLRGVAGVERHQLAAIGRGGEDRREPGAVAAGAGGVEAPAELREALGFGDGDAVDALAERAEAELQRGLGDLDEQRLERLAGVVDLGMVRGLTGELLLGDGLEERGLVGKVAVERRLGDAAGPGDVVDAGAFEAAGEEDRARAFEHLGVLLLGALRPQRRGFRNGQPDRVRHLLRYPLRPLRRRCGTVPRMPTISRQLAAAARSPSRSASLGFLQDLPRFRRPPALTRVLAAGRSAGARDRRNVKRNGFVCR